MSGRHAVADAALSVASGLTASKVMDAVTTQIYEKQSDQSKRREAEVSDGVAYNVAVTKAAGAIGVSLSDDQVSVGGQVMHYGLGVGLAPVYMLLRRKAGLTPVSAGIASGVALYVVLDEALNPLLGFTPPPQAYPAVTHLRGLAGHVILGLVLAATVEAGWAVAGRRP